ncbi:hypothetical protein QYE76_006743 [Lolium multiflorum]|uniref:Transposase (putative) gypsy type domain-containing protein n=1 Tax=Lolium multiflorum TaxID=4521 RepID=A0AAD8RVA9_LOLMU|nr:hypothetical protein QYE76_006743 [Lolium multiflorum]
METSSSAPAAGAGRGQEAGSSGQGSGVDLSAITRGAWKGSDVVQQDIDWLYRSRRIPAQVSCRIPRDEVEPAPEPGEFVVFLAHFERGFGLPASDFFREFLDFNKLQPHHLPDNAIFYLSCFVSFMEAYIGLLPTKEAFARFFCLRINSVKGKDIPKPKPPVRCGSCIVGARQGSPFFKFSGLDSCRAWQETVLYVRNKGAADFINLPAYNPETPTRANWGFNPGNDHIETNRIVRFLEKLKKETDICFPGYRPRIHLTPGASPPVLGSQDEPDARQRFPRIAAEERGPCQKRDLDEVDPDPYVVWTKNKMGRTHTSCPSNFSTEASGSDDEVTVLEAEVGREFLEKLASRGQNNKAPAPEAGSSDAPPAKRSRKEVVGGKKVTAKHYRKKGMPVASGPALKISKSATGMRPESSEGTARASPPPQPSPVPYGTGNPSASPLGGHTSAGRAAHEPSEHRAEEDIVSPPETQDTGASNIGTDTEAAGRAEPQTTPTPLPASPAGEPASAKPTPPEGTKLSAEEPAAVATAASAPSSGTWSLVLHAGRAAIVAGETASAQLGRITELTRGGAD